MARKNAFWMEFKGIRSTDIDVSIIEVPSRQRPAQKGKFIDVLGRSGGLWMPENAYEDVTIKVTCRLKESANLDEISEWLSGTGELIFSDDPDRAYHAAKAINEYDYSPVVPGSNMRSFDVTFECPPFRYMHPEADDIEIAQSGYILTGAGTYKSNPKITVAGNGDITMMVGLTQIDMDSIEGGIVIDSELMDCFTLDGAGLLNNKVTMDEFPQLAVNTTIITWTGSVSKVTIAPRWRFI